MRLSFDNVRVVVDLFMFLRAVSDHNILTLLNVSDIHNNVIVNKTLLMFLLLWLLVTLMILLVMAMRSIMISMTKVVATRFSSAISHRCKTDREKNNKELHCQKL